MKDHQRGKRGQPSLFPRIFLLALFFMAGCFAGQFFARYMPQSAGEELIGYVRQYVFLESERSGRTAVSTILLYVRYPLLAVLLGFSSLGILLIPCTAAVFGFFLSFSVSCFVSVFGLDGVWLAIAAFGLRCAITLPCFLILAEAALEHAADLAALSFGRGRRVTRTISARSRWLLAAVCLVVLLFGVCVDLMFVPRCLNYVLHQILIG